MSQAGVAYPDHPDNYGSRMQRELQAPADDQLWEEDRHAPEVTDAEADAMWAQEQELRAASVLPPHRHRCGHVCATLECRLFAMRNEWNCPDCQRELRL